MNCPRDFEDLKIVCRVCLNKNKVLILLSNYLYGDSSISGPLILDVLAYVMCTQIESNYPKTICAECLDHVKQAYHLRLKFQNSQEILQKSEQSIIISYKENDHFEVYEEDDASGYDLTHDSRNFVESNNAVERNENDCKNTSILEDPPTTVKEDRFEESLTQINWMGEDEDLEIRKGLLENFEKMDGNEEYDLNLKRTLRLKLEENTENVECRNIQVRCVDINKFVIERKLEHRNSDLKVDNCNASLGEDLNSEKASAPTMTKWKCNICYRLFSKGKIKNHLMYCRNLKITSLTCKDCNKLFKRVKDLNYHRKLKHSLNPPIFLCKICGFLCKSNSARQIHMRQEHGGKKTFICETCGKGFYHNATLLRHKSKHTKETQEVCNICGKAFHYKGALFYHTKIHTNERKYLCNFCDKKFYTSQSLQRHIDTHTGERRFKCKYCDKWFRSSSERRKHEMIHTGERPYRCVYCDQRFSTKYNHDLHVSKHQGKQPCCICDGRFLNAEVVNLHMRFKHKIKLQEIADELNIGGENSKRF